MPFFKNKSWVLDSIFSTIYSEFTWHWVILVLCRDGIGSVRSFLNRSRFRFGSIYDHIGLVQCSPKFLRFRFGSVLEVSVSVRFHFSTSEPIPSLIFINFIILNMNKVKINSNYKNIHITVTVIWNKTNKLKLEVLL